LIEQGYVDAYIAQLHCSCTPASLNTGLYFEQGLQMSTVG